MARPTILIDATPLRASSGLRGIGRFVRDLLFGLHETRREWQDSLGIRALISIQSKHSWQVSEDLPAAAEAAFAERGTQGGDLRRARRRWALHAACASGCTLMHFTEAIGMPFRSPIPRIVTCYDLIRLRYPKQYGLTFGRRWLRLAHDLGNYWLPDRVVAISHKTKAELTTLLKLPSQRIDVIALGLCLKNIQDNASNDQNFLRKLGVGPRPYVLYVGYSDYRKNVSGMLAALARVRGSMDIDLVWAGALPDSQQRAVRKQARRAGVEDHVRLLGFVSDEQLAALYRQAVAHLFLSRLEGFGLSVAEAMAAGCPIVVGLGSGSDEVVGDAAIRVGPDDADSAARGILKLANDQEFRAKLIRSGLERVRTYDRKQMAREYVASYGRLLAAKG